MKQIIKIMSLSLVFVLLFALTSGATIVSPALDVIASEYGLTKVSLISRDVYFESGDFEATTGIEGLDSISVISLPDSSHGTLMLGNITVAPGQNVSRKNLDNLRFVPRTDSPTEASFDFSPNGGSGSAYTCNIHLLERENSAPRVISSSLSTYNDIPVYGTLKAFDPENDPVKFELVSKPVNGTISFNDDSPSSFIYTPTVNKSAPDSFEYVAVDKYGNRSETATVSLNIRESDTNVFFADLDGHWAHFAAIRCASTGVMSFSTNEGEYMFTPDAPVSRAEFCASLMKNAGYTGFNSVSGTGYADDSDIPEEYKGYISAASVLGVTKGVANGESVSFCPNNQITRAEAAVMIERLYNISDNIETSVTDVLPVFNDYESVPAWARDSMNALCSAGIINGSADGNISPYTGLTRAQVAVMLNNITEAGIVA